MWERVHDGKPKSFLISVLVLHAYEIAIKDYEDFEDVALQ